MGINKRCPHFYFREGHRFWGYNRIIKCFKITEEDISHLNQIRQEYLKAYKVYADFADRYLLGSEKINGKLFNQHQTRSKQIFNDFMTYVHK